MFGTISVKVSPLKDYQRLRQSVLGSPALAEACHKEPMKRNGPDFTEISFKARLMNSNLDLQCLLKLVHSQIAPQMEIQGISRSEVRGYVLATQG
jgi:hypothetical protein